MTDDEDFERASEWIDKFGENRQIKPYYQNRGWNELTKQEKTNYIQLQFNKGAKGYESSSRKLVDGIDYIRGNEDEYKIIFVRNRRVLYNTKTKRFYRWLK